MSDPTPHLEPFESYEQACRNFQWVIPERLNIATAICRRHSEAITRVAVSEVKRAGVNTYTFGGLDFLSDKFAMVLARAGIKQGDSIATVLPPSAALIVAQLGALKAGAVVVPLSITWQPALLGEALANCKARVLIADESICGPLESTATNLPDLGRVLVARDLRPSTAATRRNDFWTDVDQASSDFSAVETDSGSPAFMFYYASQNELRRLLHSHAFLIPQLPAFEMSVNLEVDTAVLWGSGDWCSASSLLGVVYSALWSGCEVVACAPNVVAGALALTERCKITHAFVSAAEVRALLRVPDRKPAQYRPQLIVTDAPKSNAERQTITGTLGVATTSVYGTLQTGLIAASCPRWFESPPGSIGRAAPGHSIEIIDDSGNVLPHNQQGRIAIRRRDFPHRLDYQNTLPFIGDWLLTGDSGYKDEDGNLYVTPRFETRDPMA